MQSIPTRFRLSPKLWSDGQYPTMDQYRAILKRGYLLYSLDVDSSINMASKPPISAQEASERPANLLYQTNMEGYGRTDASGFKGPARNETLLETVDKTRMYMDSLHEKGIPVLTYQNENNFDEFVFSKKETAEMCAELEPFAWAFSNEGRRFACVNKPGWRKYLVERLIIRVGHAGADGVFMDNNTPFIHCRCSFCRSLYRKKFGPSANMAEDMGRPETVVADMRVFDYIGSKQVPKDLVRVDNPDLMRYLEWRIERLIDFYKHLRSELERSIGRNIIFTANGHVGIAEQTAIMLSDVLDIIFSEDGMSAPPVSNAFNLRLGTVIGEGDRCAFILTRTMESSPTADMVEVLNAEGRALGGQAEFWDLHIRDDEKLQRSQRKMREFFTRRSELYTTEKDANEIAILYSWRSDLWTSQAISPAKMMAALLEDLNLPHDILIAERPRHVERLARYKLLLVPHVEILPESWFQAVQHFLDQGGRVISTAKTGHLNEHLRPRKSLWNGSGWKHTDTRAEKEYFAQRKAIGIHAGYSRPQGILTEWIDQSLPQPAASLETNMPLLTLNHTSLPDGEALHIVNRYVNVFPFIPLTPRKNIGILIRPIRPADKVLWLVPGMPPQKLQMAEHAGALKIVVPKLLSYGIVRLYYERNDES